MSSSNELQVIINDRILVETSSEESTADLFNSTLNDLDYFSYKSREMVAIARDNQDNDNELERASGDDEDEKYNSETLLRTNREIIASNIKKFKIGFWCAVIATLLSSLMWLWLASTIVFEDSKTIGFTLIRHYIPSICLFEFLIGVFIAFIAAFRSKYLASSFTLAMFQLAFITSSIQYIVTIPLAGVLFSRDLSGLENRMQSSLNITDETWNNTQAHLKCCGINTHKDWNDDPNDIVYFQVYPASCCPREEKSCTGTDVWNKGCYDIQFKVIEWFGGWMISLLICGLISSTIMQIQLHRLWRYLLIYRPWAVV